jgi:tetratricopeptide (TPR) repeat protein
MAGLLGLAIGAACSPDLLIARPATAPPEDPTHVLQDESFSTRLIATCDSLYTAGCRDSSAALVSRWLPVARAGNDSLLLIDLLIRQGAPLISFGAPQPAEPPLREALALAEAKADSQRICLALRWLAATIDALGRHEEARALSLRQRGLAHRLGKPRLEAWALNMLGWGDLVAGHARDAVAHYGEACRFFRQADDTQGEAWVRNGLGMALESAGDYAAARRSYARAGELAARSRYAMVEGWAMNNLAGLEYSMGDPGAALHSFERALQVEERLNHLAEMVVPLLNIAMCQTDLAHFAAAGSTLSRAERICREHGYGDLLFQTMERIADLQLRRGDTDQARRTYRELLPASPAVAVNDRVLAEIGLARTLARCDSTEAALRLLAASKERLGSDFTGGLPFEIMALQGDLLLRQDRPEEALALLLAVRDDQRARDLQGVRLRCLEAAARCWKSIGEPDSALATLRNASDLWEKTRESSLDPEWRELRSAIGRSIHVGLADLILAGTGRAAGQGIQRAFDRLQTYKARTLLERMQGPEIKPRRTHHETDEVVASLERVQALLREDELLLDVYLGPQESLIFAVGADTQAVRRLPPADRLLADLGFCKELLLLPLRERPTAQDTRGLWAALAAAGSSLLGELEPLVAAASQVIVVPDGNAAVLPLAALHFGRRESADQGVSQTWTVVPSASVFCMLRSSTARPNPSAIRSVPRVLAMAGPTAPPVRKLRGTRREIAELARRYAGVSIGDGALAARFASGDLTGWDVLHFATHVSLRGRPPWHAALILPALGDSTGSSATEENQELTAAAIAAGRVDARLTVLAGCESALGYVLPGEGALGLTSAFLSAGSRAVVASLWPVDDSITADLMVDLYAGLQEGRTVADALKEAQNYLRSRRATGHPYYWAGFVLVGDGDVSVPLRQSTDQARPGKIAILLLLVAGALAILVNYRRTKIPYVIRRRETRL